MSLSFAILKADYHTVASCLQHKRYPLGGRHGDTSLCVTHGAQGRLRSVSGKLDVLPHLLSAGRPNECDAFR
jgi:hypothetical protein